MKPFRFLFRYLTIGLFCLSLSSCMSAPKAIVKGPQTIIPGQESVIKAQDSFVKILRIDGQRPVVEFPFRFVPRDAGAEVTMAPGDHVVNVVFDNIANVGKLWGFRSSYDFQLYARPERTYIVKYELANKAARLWIEDSQTSQHMEHVLASQNEPLLDVEVKLDQCPLFSMMPPKESGWIVDKRNKSEILIYRMSGSHNERYIISVALFDLPKLVSDQEFLAQLRQAQSNARNKSGAFVGRTILMDTMELVTSRKDYCAKYHIVSQSLTPARFPMTWTTPDNSEMVGFACRQPDNKNFGINFAYMHLYDAGHEDPNLDSKASDTFDSISF